MVVDEEVVSAVGKGTLWTAGWVEELRLFRGNEGAATGKQKKKIKKRKDLHCNLAVDGAAQGLKSNIMF